MESLIDELHNDHIKCNNVLDLLAEQLNKIHNGKSADYRLMLDAVSYLETNLEYALIPKEDVIFKESTENYDIEELNDTIQQFRSENHEIMVLIHNLRNYIDAALEDSIFEKKPFERQLEKCIQRQREHMNTEENIIFPLLRKIMSEEQLKKISTDFESQTNIMSSDNTSYKYTEFYHRITDNSDPNIHKAH